VDLRHRCEVRTPLTQPPAGPDGRRLHAIATRGAATRVPSEGCLIAPRPPRVRSVSATNGQAGLATLARRKAPSRLPKNSTTRSLIGVRRLEGRARTAATRHRFPIGHALGRQRPGRRRPSAHRAGHHDHWSGDARRAPPHRCPFAVLRPSAGKDAAVDRVREAEGPSRGRTGDSPALGLQFGPSNIRFLGRSRWKAERGLAWASADDRPSR